MYTSAVLLLSGLTACVSAASRAYGDDSLQCKVSSSGSYDLVQNTNVCRTSCNAAVANRDAWVNGMRGLGHTVDSGHPMPTCVLTPGASAGKGYGGKSSKGASSTCVCTWTQPCAGTPTLDNCTRQACRRGYGNAWSWKTTAPPSCASDTRYLVLDSVSCQCVCNPAMNTAACRTAANGNTNVVWNSETCTCDCDDEALDTECRRQGDNYRASTDGSCECRCVKPRKPSECANWNPTACAWVEVPRPTTTCNTQCVSMTCRSGGGYGSGSGGSHRWVVTRNSDACPRGTVANSETCCCDEVQAPQCQQGQKGCDQKSRRGYDSEPVCPSKPCKGKKCPEVDARCDEGPRGPVELCVSKSQAQRLAENPGPSFSYAYYTCERDCPCGQYCVRCEDGFKMSGSTPTCGHSDAWVKDNCGEWGCSAEEAPKSCASGKCGGGSRRRAY